MSTLSSSGRRAPFSTRFADAARHWAHTDGLTWIYIAKVLLACALALGISMKLELAGPRTAMTTVFIVMQPQSGPVFAKSFYRMCGTLVGLVAMMTLISLFSQQPVLFIGGTAVWVGICTAGAARNRNFRSYGFVLAGYTAALIGFPAAQQADTSFITALTRVAEVSTGILCAGAVSALVFPQHSGLQLRSTVRARYSSFVDYVSAVLAGRIARDGVEAANAKFVADTVGFEAARSAAVFESPDARMRNGRLARMNSEFMTASTRLHALHQLMNRLHAMDARDDAGQQAATAAIAAIEPYFHELSALLADGDEPVRTASEAERAAANLDTFRSALPKRVRATRRTLEADTHAPLLDFDTAAEMLYRFVDDLHAYTATYASLAVDTHARERSIERYVPKTNAIAALVAGLRAAIAIGLCGAFWLLTAWPSGAMLTLTAAAVCALASSSPNPARTAFQMGGGVTLAVILGMVVMFGVYPRLDGFAMLFVGLAPFLALGAFMTTRPALMGYGLGYCIFFCTLAGPDNLVHYDPMGFMNDGLALVLAMALSAIAFAVLLPPSTRWMRERMVSELRRRVAYACRARLTGLRGRFESGARDLLHQLSALAGGDQALRREALRWLFAVLEVGHAVIDLRHELATLPRASRHSTPWYASVDALLKPLAALFDSPRAARLVAARDAADRAIAALARCLADPAFAEPESREAREAWRRLQRILSHLHFVRSALIDPQSPFGALADPANDRDDQDDTPPSPSPSQGDSHAA